MTVAVDPMEILRMLERIGGSVAEAEFKYQLPNLEVEQLYELEARGLVEIRWGLTAAGRREAAGEAPDAGGRSWGQEDESAPAPPEPPRSGRARPRPRSVRDVGRLA